MQRLEAVKVLVEAGANVNAQDASGRTILHWAVFADFRRIVAFLLSLGSPTVSVV